MTKAFTDHVHQRVRLYIEGIEVPFTSITVMCGIGGLPTATITVPPQAGLMDIARFYQPKVHIFYTDIINDYNTEEEADKLLFSGIIARPAYFKSKDTESSAGVSFECVHKYNFLNDMLIDYTGWLTADPLGVDTSTGLKADTANSVSTVIEALSGIKDPKLGGGTEITYTNPDGQTNILPNRYYDYYNRLLGMPGVIMNFWNQMKRSAFNRQLRQGNLYYSEAFVQMYQPLTEDGLQFFDRMGGHYPIEAMVQADENRIDPCPETPGKKEKIVIPPSRQLFLSSSVQAQMTVSNIANYLQNSGEVTTIYEIFNNFYESIDYEIVTLASPAEVAIRPTTVSLADGSQESVSQTTSQTYALDTIVKPKIPFYFSPTCNVLFPGMYSRVNVIYDEISVPTRVNLKNLEGPGDNGYRTNFRAPHSIREAIAGKVAGVNGKKGYDPNAKYSLIATTGQSYGAIGLYEQGRGIKQETMHMPRWLSQFSQSTLGGNQPVKDETPDASKEPGRVEALRQLAAGWAKRYPGSPITTLNPFAIEADISAHHRLLFSAADYYYTQAFARSKAGTVDCPFNPHIVPGYPMDIVEDSPLYPSFHAMCSQVTHVITGSSISTHVQFVAAMTYAELANYYIPFVSPMVQVALSLAESPTLVEVSEEARKTADEFYMYTLGTSAVIPEELLDFSTMTLKPKKRDASGGWTDGSTGSVQDSNGGEKNPMLSYYGNLSLTYRDIEDKQKIQTRFGIKFIDMSPANYGPKVMKYRDAALNTETRFELGRSQFLTYDTYFGQLVEKQNPTGVSTIVDRGGNVTQVIDLNSPNLSSERRGK